MAKSALSNLGWSQGCMVKSQDLAFYSFKGTQDGKLEAVPRTRKDTDQFVVISQDCDIAAAEDVEPYVEMLLCRPAKNEGEVRRAQKNSARRFLVDEKRQLVALASFGAFVKKKDASQLKPEPWPGDEFSLERFRQWLGWRYTRPAVPDEIESAFSSPCREVIERLRADGSPVEAAVNQWVEEIRYLYFEAEPPYEIQPLFLVAESFDPAVESSVNALLDAWEEVVDPSVVSLRRPPVIMIESEVTRGIDRASTKLYLDYLTLVGEEAEVE